MKKIFAIVTIVFLTISTGLFSQNINTHEVYLLTCGPGTETYSHWGHSALRITDPVAGTDRVYNWGVFDFATPAFAWKFARGRLEYMLGVTTYERFLQEYFMEGRWVQSQKINLEPEEIDRMLILIAENLKPENVRYRYDFFYDDCSTRIRDLFEKSVGSKLLYPPEEKATQPTFRFMLGKYLGPAPWLEFGIDLLVGLPGNKKASFRDRMFLPIDMQEALSDAVVNRNSKMVPLLQNPETVLESEAPAVKQRFLTSPVFILSLILIIIILISSLVRERRALKGFDIFLFSIFSILALIMIFFNFFTDHQQTKWNINIVWLSPFIILCLLSLVLDKNWHTWFRIVFVLCTLSFLVLVVFTNASNNAFLPIVVMIMVRSSARAGLSWNPLSVTEEG
jgi:hypothetical protein